MTTLLHSLYPGDDVTISVLNTLIQITVYCGVPAGVEAFRLAREVLDAEGIDPEAAK